VNLFDLLLMYSCPVAVWPKTLSKSCGVKPEHC